MLIMLKALQSTTDTHTHTLMSFFHTCQCMFLCLLFLHHGLSNVLEKLECCLKCILRCPPQYKWVKEKFAHKPCFSDGKHDKSPFRLNIKELFFPRDPQISTPKTNSPFKVHVDTSCAVNVIHAVSLYKCHSVILA